MILRIAVGPDAAYIHRMDRPRVVLAEDHARIAEQLRKLLEPEFDVVAMVTDGHGLLQAEEDFRPDVVHLHNVYHHLSPSILGPVARRRIPAVMTLHDYKLACPSYQFLDHGNLCQACLGGHFQNAIRRRCKDGSLGASVVVATELFIHTRTGAYAPVRRFICPSRFLAGRMKAAGVFPDRLRQVPHFVPIILYRQPFVKIGGTDAPGLAAHRHHGSEALAREKVAAHAGE